MLTMEDAYRKAEEIVADKWGVVPSESCRYGHQECARVEGGKCWNEEVDKATVALLVEEATRLKG